MLIPKGQTTSLMDTETIDLYSITGTHGTRLPDTHAHTHRYFHSVYKNIHWDYSTYSIHVSSPAHLSREGRKCTALSAHALSGIVYNMQGISEAIKYFLVASRLRLNSVCT